MPKVLGIDMGASFVKAVYIADDDGSLQPVLNRNSDCMFRVCGVMQPNGALRTLTKEEDRKLALEKGEHLIENVKPRRGEEANGDVLEVAVLKDVLECYREQTHNFDLSNLDRIVLTHPVSPRPASVAALKRIAVLAGLPEGKLDTIEEPVALGCFAKYLRPEIDGRLLVIDAGHYTTDLAVLETRDGNVTVAPNYLGLRFGVAELCHRIARSLWIKAQLVGGADSPSESPFDEAGPEANHPFVQKLCAWAEREIIRAIGDDFFGPDFHATAVLNTLTQGIDHLGPWREKINILQYHYDLSAAQVEDLARSYPHHNIQAADRIRQENYKAAIRPLVRGLCAAALGFVFETSERDRACHIALGGGMSLIPEVREAISRLLSACGLPAPIDLNYQYRGLGPLAVGRLLSIAAGAAIAGTQRFTRVDTLSDTLGMIASYELEDALFYLDHENSLPKDFDPSSAHHLSQMGAKTAPNNVVIVPLHRILATRGTELPIEVSFPDDLVVLAAGGTINLTRYGDQVSAFSVAPASQPGGGIIAQIGVPRPSNPELPLRLFLRISRNDVWELTVKDAFGATIVRHEVTLDLKGRE